MPIARRQVNTPRNSAPALLQEAVRLHQAGRLADAISRYTAVQRMDHRNFDALHLGGLASLQAGNATAALRLLSAAHRVQPGDVTCAMRLALAERAAGRIDAAEQRLRKLTRQYPQVAEIWDNLGQTLKSRGAIAEALDCHLRATHADSNFGTAWYNLGLTHNLLGQHHEALAAQEQALRCKKPHARARYGRAIALQQLHRLPEALDSYDQHLRLEPAHHAAHSGRLLCRQYLDDFDATEHARVLEAYAKSLPRPIKSTVAASSGSRLRIGFVSGDFRRHSVAWFMLPLLRHLDRDRFHLTLYHDHGIVDEITREFESLVDNIRQTVSLGPADFSRIVRKDKIDIAIDLAGHTGGNRLPVFATRLAPVQINYLGYPDTTGVPAMDYRFVDSVTDPISAPPTPDTETPVRFSTTAWAYQPPAEAPEPSPGPSARGHPITFGSFNNFAKVSDATLDLWSDVLAACPGSRLVLKSDGLEPATVAAICERHEINQKRISLLQRTPDTASHLAQYADIDIALDPLPYHGTTTTCEALWMGVPVITLAGNRHANRVGASLLRAVGRPHWIAGNNELYIAIARDLASGHAVLAVERARLRADMQTSPLLDYAGQAQKFGAALESCWLDATGETPVRAAA